MKKIVFLVLTLLLMTGLCLGIGFSAMAAETDGSNALEQEIMAGYALAQVPADAKPVGSYADFVGMATDGVYYLTADFKASSSYLLTFEGELYGNGHTLTLSGNPLFTELNGATVCDIVLEGSVNNVAASGLNYVGALTREAYGSTIVGITNKADIHQEIREMFAGGVAGYAENTTFKYCVNYGNVTGNTDAFRPGGILGEINNADAWLVIENCVNHGTVNGRNQTGGIMSRAENAAWIRLSYCANFGTINVAGSDSGGIIGKVTQGHTNVTFEHLYNSGAVNGGSIAGGISGPTAAKKLIATDCYNGCFVDGCDCNGTNHGAITQKAAGDIGGLFGTINISGHIEVELVNCINYGKVTANGNSRTGGIAGCMETKTLSAKNCHNYGDLSSENYIGGLFSRAGCTEGTLLLENCSNSGNITTNSYAGGIIGYQQYSLAIKMVNCVNNGTLSTGWNAGGILCRIDKNVVTMTGAMEFINCVNNGDVVKSSGTVGGILGILEPGDIAKIPSLVFTNCQNTGDLLAPNYAGGMTGIAHATATTMINCSNSGNMDLMPEKDEYAEVGGLAGRIYGSLVCTDCVNSGNVLVTAKPSTQTATLVLGGIVGRVGQAGNDYTAETATFTRCVNTGIIGGSKAIADAATTYVIGAGGLIGNSRSTCYAYNCVSTGDVFGNQQVAGICALSGQNNKDGHTYRGNYVSGYIYSSGHKGQYNSAGAAGLSCYGWGYVIVEYNVVTANIEVNNTGSGKAMSDRWACSALFGYTNTSGGNFKYNYFTGTLTTDGGDNCYKIIVANTKGHDHTSREGNQMVHNYSVNQYNLHCNEKIGYSVSKSTSITPEAMVALHSSLRLVTLCDGTALPLARDTQAQLTKAQNVAGHTYGDWTATADPNNHSASCACGATIYEAHVYDNACDTDCNTCGYVRFEQPTHQGAFECSEACRHCGTAITPATTHAGTHACSTNCATCGTVIAGAEHTVDGDCDTVCNLCGEALNATAEHTLVKLCGDTCSVCGEYAETAEHQGAVDCAPSCRWCGTAIVGTDHEGEHTCSTTCKHCGTTIWGEPHAGLADCATACQWCGIALETTVQHTHDNACDTDCNACGETREVAAHSGEFACSVTCKDCGILISPEAEHTAEFVCSMTCKYCGAGLPDAEAHDYTDDCDVDCGVCGEIRTTAHVYGLACDADCDICGFVRSVEHGGEHLCSDICRWCGETITPASHHVGLYECSEICKWCAGQVADEDRVDHTYDHNCDTVCDVCSGEREVEGHSGVYPCDTVCQWCEAPITNPGAHVYDNSCDPNCNNCGAIRLTARHAFDNDCDPDCNKSDCDYVREVAHGYDNDCDKDCNKCGETRETQHVYDNACDNNCNACGDVDVLREHTYDFACDAECNVCGATREADHAYAGPCSGVCTKCEQQIRDDAHDIDTWETVTAATAEAEGLEKGVCTFCGEEVTRAVAKLPASDANAPAATGTILGMSTDLFILVIAAVALVIFNIVVISIVSAKKKKEKTGEDAPAEESEPTEATEEAETTEEKADEE